MENDERMLWELFCATGEPRYYSMYVREHDRVHGKDNDKKR